MPRIRSVHPDICVDEELAEVSARAERTFVRLWTHLDDKGRCVDNPRIIKAALYPLHDDMTATEVDADLDELVLANKLIRYEADGKRVVAAKPESWSARQSPRHPTASKLPAPPETKRGITADRGKGSADRRKAHAGVGEGVGEGVGGCDAAVAAPDTRRRRTQCPATFEVSESLRTWAKDKAFRLVDIDAETEQFLEHHRAKGSLMLDWNAAWRKWMCKAEEYASERASRGRNGNGRTPEVWTDAFGNEVLQ